MEAFKRLRETSARVFWCPNCDVPIMDEVCGLCGGRGERVKVTPPADVRPALKGDVEHVRALVEEYAGSGYVARRLVPEVFLLNKIPYPDAADEIIVGGQVVGHRFYDLRARRWRFKPLYAGVAALVEMDAGYYAIVDLPRLARGYEIHRDRIVGGRLPGSRGEFVAVQLASGAQQALAVSVRGGRLRVVKAWASRGFRGQSQVSWNRVLRANMGRLARLEGEAMRFVESVAGRYRLPAVVSFSGGKDSLVTYDLVSRVLGDVPVIFNDTGLELPETVEYVRSFAARRGVELIEAGAGDAFWRALRLLGPPARDYRWCCKVTKLAPIARVLRERFPGGVLSFVGQRALESAARAASPRVWRNRWLPGLVAAAPIHRWTALEVWLYIFKYGLEYNPLYDLGFDRLGCWLCPACEMGEYEMVRRVHPELWGRWEAELGSAAEVLGMGKKWIDYGLWRWREVPGDVAREARVPKGHQGPRVMGLSVIPKDNLVEVRLSKPPDPARVENMLVTLGRVERVDGGWEVETRDGVARIKVDGHGATLEGPWEEALVPLVRAAYCCGCGMCEVWCPQGAIRLEGVAVVDEDSCTRCGTCNLRCPLGQYLMLGLH